MDRIWAPWRIGYITGDKPEECVFCRRPQEGDDRAAGILWRGERAYVILNAYPYNNGHLMVVPYRHVSRLDELEPAVLHDLIELVRDAGRILRADFDCEGLNVGLNLGEAAGAGIADHLHVHVVPRWFGDTNFSTTVGELRVIPQSLDDAWQTLRPAFVELLGPDQAPPSTA